MKVTARGVIVVVVVLCLGVGLFFATLSQNPSEPPSSVEQQPSLADEQQRYRRTKHVIIADDLDQTQTVASKKIERRGRRANGRLHQNGEEEEGGECPPHDIRVLGSPSRDGGLGHTVKTNRMWLVSYRSQAWEWFEKKYSKCLLSSQVSSSSSSSVGSNSSKSNRVGRWSCGVGWPFPRNSTIPVPGLSPALYPNMSKQERFWLFDAPLYIADVDEPQLVSSLGKRWGFPRGPPRSSSDNTNDDDDRHQHDHDDEIPQVRHWLHSHLPAPCANPPWQITTKYEPHFARRMQVQSVSVNQLTSACLDSMQVLDGRAPSFAHAMSRRCKDPDRIRAQRLTLVGIGHSHTRFLFGMLCMLGNHSWCGDFSRLHFHVPIYPMLSFRWWERQEQHTQFKLFYTAGWYDLRLALIRTIVHLLPKHLVRKIFLPGNTDLPKPPNITVFHEEDLGTLRKQQSTADESNPSSSKTKTARTLTNQWDFELRQWISDILPHLAGPIPTHFVVSRGEWDMHYLSPSMSALVLQMQKFLELIHVVFPSAVIFLQLPQRHYNRPIPKQDSPLRRTLIYRAVCASERRVQSVRDMNVCAAHRAMASTASLGDRIVLFDSDPVTRSGFGQSFLDYAGHHYTDEALEVLALEIRNIATSPELQRRYSERARNALLRYSPSRDPFLLSLFHKKNKKAARKWFRKSSSSTSGGAGGVGGAVWGNNGSDDTSDDAMMTSTMDDEMWKLDTNVGGSCRRLFPTINARGEEDITMAEGTSPQTDDDFDNTYFGNAHRNLFGFPPRPFSVQTFCTCHRDVPLNATVCNYLHSKEKIPPRDFVLYNTMMARSAAASRQRKNRTGGAADDDSPTRGAPNNNITNNTNTID